MRLHWVVFPILELIGIFETSSFETSSNDTLLCIRRMFKLLHWVCDMKVEVMAISFFGSYFLT